MEQHENKDSDRVMNDEENSNNRMVDFNNDRAESERANHVGNNTSEEKQGTCGRVLVHRDVFNSMEEEMRIITTSHKNFSLPYNCCKKCALLSKKN